MENLEGRKSSNQKDTKQNNIEGNLPTCNAKLFLRSKKLSSSQVMNDNFLPDSYNKMIDDTVEEVKSQSSYLGSLTKSWGDSLRRILGANPNLQSELKPDNGKMSSIPIKDNISSNTAEITNTKPMHIKGDRPLLRREYSNPVSSKSDSSSISSSFSARSFGSDFWSGTTPLRETPPTPQSLDQFQLVDIHKTIEEETRKRQEKVGKKGREFVHDILDTSKQIDQIDKESVRQKLLLLKEAMAEIDKSMFVSIKEEAKSKELGYKEIEHGHEKGDILVKGTYTYVRSFKSEIARKQMNLDDHRQFPAFEAFKRGFDSNQAYQKKDINERIEEYLIWHTALVEYFLDEKHTKPVKKYIAGRERIFERDGTPNQWNNALVSMIEKNAENFQNFIEQSPLESM